MTGAKRGPKPKAPEDKRDARMEVAMTRDEKSALCDAANDAGMPVTVYVREAALRRARRKR